MVQLECFPEERREKKERKGEGRKDRLGRFAEIRVVFYRGKSSCEHIWLWFAFQGEFRSRELREGANVGSIAQRGYKIGTKIPVMRGYLR